MLLFLWLGQLLKRHFLFACAFGFCSKLILFPSPMGAHVCWMTRDFADTVIDIYP
jgi:hypothetical protein